MATRTRLRLGMDDLRKAYDAMPRADREARETRAQRGQAHRFLALEALRLMFGKAFIRAGIQAGGPGGGRVNEQGERGVTVVMSPGAAEEMWNAAQMGAGTFEEWVRTLPVVVEGEEIKNVGNGDQ